MFKIHTLKTEIPDLTLTDGICPVPLGVSLAYIIVVDYRNMFPKIAYHLQLVRNDGEQITVLP